MKEDVSVSIKKVKNGWIAEVSWNEGKGDNKEWKNEEWLYLTVNEALAKIEKVLKAL